MTPRGVSRFSPTRNPRRNTAAAARTQVGQTDASAPSAPAEADPQPATDQIREHGVDERDAAEDLAAVEERERDREPEEREQIEVPHRERPTEVPEAEKEDEAEREPDVGLQEGLAAERPLAAARHLPGDLRPGPRLDDPPGRVLDHHVRDLARRARPHLDLPRSRVHPEVGRRRGLRRIAVEPVRHLRVRERELDRLALVEAGKVARIRLGSPGRGEDEREGRERGDGD